MKQTLGEKITMANFFIRKVAQVSGIFHLLVEYFSTIVRKHRVQFVL